jgi:hypothetical protein
LNKEEAGNRAASNPTPITTCQHLSHGTMLFLNAFQAIEKRQVEKGAAVRLRIFYL